MINSAGRSGRNRGRAARVHISPKPLCVLLMIGVALTAPANALDPQKFISQFTHTSWTAKDGIPGPVRAIAQTPDGYLWLGTEAGLYRFDGLRFAAWKPSSGQQFRDSSVLSLCVARDGSLWIGFGSGGITQLRDGHLKNYSHADGVPTGGILSVVEDANGSIWAGGQYGLSKLDSGGWRQVGTELGYPAPGAQVIFVDRRGNLWVATDGFDFGLGKDSVRRNTILTLAANAKRFAATQEAVGQVWMMAEAPDGEVWIADTTGRTARPIMRQSGRKLGITVGVESVCVLFDSNRSLWVGLIQGGLRRVADSRQLERNALDEFSTRDGLSSGGVYSALEDREGNIWFGTTGGLDRFRENKVTPYSNREGLIPDQKIAMAPTQDGSVWFVSYTRDTVQRFRQGRITTSKLPLYSRSDSTRILSLNADRNNHVWAGGSFKLAEGVDGRFSYTRGPPIEKGAMVHAIARDAGGNLWITVWGGEKGGGPLRLRDGNWTDFRGRVNLPQYRCRVLYGDPLGRVWLGFEDGEVAVRENEEFHVYSSKDGLPGGRVLAITSDQAGNFWIGTEGGLSRFDKGRFVTLTKDNGLPGNSVSGILEDDDGFLWLAGALAILRVNPQELEKALRSSSYRMQFASFDATDGLRGLPRQGEPFPTATRAADGRLWFSTTEGIAVIDPRHLPRNIVPPPVTIEAVKADDQALPVSSGLHLRPRTKSLQFEFAALSLTAPERVSFRYKLEGFDADWRGPVSAREVAYTNLPPRNYRFRLVACNNDGVWNEDGAALDFTLLPAFYQTDWFLLLCVAAAGSLVWATYQWHIRQVAARLDLKFEARLAERTRIAQELHDTLLQGFLSASMQLHVADDRLPADSAAKPIVKRVLELMGQVIDDGRKALRGLRSPTAESDNLEQALSRIPQEFILEQPIDFRVIVEGPARPLHPVIRDEVYRIGREALANAFRHSRASGIEVELEYAEKQLRVLVRDNGCGIDPEVLRSGRDGHWGLSGIRERAERIGGRVKVWSRPAGGTEVELSVPSHVAFRQYSSGGGLRWLDRFRLRKIEQNVQKPRSGQQK